MVLSKNDFCGVQLRSTAAEYSCGVQLRSTKIFRGQMEVLPLFKYCSSCAVSWGGTSLRSTIAE